jgi:DNA replication protein DnaC
VSGQSDLEMRLRLADIDTSAGIGTQAMVTAARAFVQSPVAIMTITGSCGNGKSDTLHAIVNELIEKGVEAMYTTIFDLMGWVKEAFNDNGQVKSESAWARLKRIEEVRVLCVDEFDKLQRTPWLVDQITDLVDSRHRYGLDGTRGTVLAMNADISTLPDWIYSRLRDGRNQRVVNMDADLRPLMER